MKKIIKFIKSNILGFLVGLSLCLNGVIIAENMLSSEQVSYTGSKTSETTVKGTLDQLFDAVDINERLGSTDISSIGDGTITGAISNVNNTVSDLNSNVLGVQALSIDSWKSCVTSSQFVSFLKSGRMAVFSFALNGNFPSGVTNVGKLSTGPTYSGIYFSFHGYNDTVSMSGHGSISTDGTIEIALPQAATTIVGEVYFIV